MAELFQVLTPVDALRRLLDHLSITLTTEEVPVQEALGRVLAMESRSPTPLPTFLRSNMDGYAVRAQDTFGASDGLPAYLKVVGEVRMGQSPTVRPGPGEAVSVPTGGMIPQGADAVIIVEHTQMVDPTTIEAYRAVAPGENVIQVGEDMEQGELLLPKGHSLRSQDVGGLLAVGILAVPVVRRPRVVIIATGDEVVPPEVEPTAGQIRDINTYTLAALIMQSGGIPVPLGIIRDDYDGLKQAAERGIAQGDVLIISAGSSVSTRDITAGIIGTLGSPGVLVHGVAVKPGKPTILAVCGGKPVFGLPGNPVSTFVTFDLFVRPALSHLLGTVPQERLTVRARLAKNVASIFGREDHIPVRLLERGGEFLAEPVFGKSSLIFTLVKAHGLITIPLDVGGLSAGQMVEVRRF
ncbi:MAG TPA: gephyrin-like molybdotransferase Glp [Candidatus Methylomirabilis sp.]|nr:gephyrin-like molybdotransferase Glp [Candidatus Methylomirabilis sp.]